MSTNNIDIVYFMLKKTMRTFSAMSVYLQDVWQVEALCKLRGDCGFANTSSTADKNDEWQPLMMEPDSIGKKLRHHENTVQIPPP